MGASAGASAGTRKRSLAQAPRSALRQRSLQNGRQGLAAPKSAGWRQLGHGTLRAAGSDTGSVIGPGGDEDVPFMPQAHRLSSKVVSVPAGRSRPSASGFMKRTDTSSRCPLISGTRPSAESTHTRSNW